MPDIIAVPGSRLYLVLDLDRSRSSSSDVTKECFCITWSCCIRDGNT